MENIYKGDFHMDEVLLKKIAQYVKSKGEVPKSISGYSDDIVSAAVQDMFNKKVIKNTKATKYSPNLSGNQTITIGSPISVEKKGEIDIVMLSEYDFEEVYGITWY